MNGSRVPFVRGLLLLMALLAGHAVAHAEDALLVVAHGSRSAEWNERVVRLVSQVNWPGPVGVAFLMDAPPEHTLDRVAAQLDQTGVARIIIVPLLVSSFSGHYEEIRYYIGQRQQPPEHAHYTPLKTCAQLVLTPSMDDHPLVSEILLDQVRALSQVPAEESVILVAHGPNDEEDNYRWLERLRTHAGKIHERFGFRRVEVVTLRDDAPGPIRDGATAYLRAVVSVASADSHVLVVPVLISVGYIQQQIRERLEGLEYVMADSGLVDHPLAAEWIRQQASQPGTTAFVQAGQHR